MWGQGDAGWEGMEEQATARRLLQRRHVGGRVRRIPPMSLRPYLEQTCGMVRVRQMLKEYIETPKRIRLHTRAHTHARIRTRTRTHI